MIRQLLVCLFAGVASSNGCARLNTSVAERHIVSGGTVASLVAASDTAVVLIYKPSDAFVCNGSLQPWLSWGRRHPRAFALVFTREPTPAERRQLATYRIHPDGLLQRRTLDVVNPPRSPVELLLVRGRLVATEPVARRTLATPLYRRLTTGSSGRSASRAFLPQAELRRYRKEPHP